jgi:hypothetical protein
MPRWQYRVLSKQQLLKTGKQDLAAGLNQLGKQGWELVGIDGGYIFKRRAPSGPASVEDLKRRLAEAERDVDAQREHLAWSQLMARRGVVSEAYLQTEERIMQHVEAAAEQARRDLDAGLLPAPKQAPSAPSAPSAPAPKTSK